MNFKKTFKKLNRLFSIEKRQNPKLDNYFFVKNDGFIDKVVLEESNEIHAVGVVTGRPGVPDGSRITTSRIAKRTSSSITTKSGSKYILGEPHPDFVALKEAIKNDIPVITEWHLNGKHYLSGNDFLTKDPIEGVIIAQDGNYITLQNCRYNNETTRYFVIWRNVDLATEIRLVLDEGVLNLGREKFKRQFALNCVPTFF